MKAIDFYNLPTGSMIEIDGPHESDLRDLHRLGFHPTLMTGQGQTLVKQLSPGYAFRGAMETEAEFQAACHALLTSERALPRVTLA
jgi:hypothetical protein